MRRSLDAKRPEVTPKTCPNSIGRFARAALLVTLAAGCGQKKDSSELNGDSVETLQRLLSAEEELTQCLETQITDRKKLIASMEAEKKLLEQDEELIDIDKLPERIEVLDVDGEPKVGTVIHLRQIHNTPVNPDAKEFERVTVYQQRMLAELMVIKPDAVMPEAWGGVALSKIDDDHERARVEELIKTDEPMARFAKKVISKGLNALDDEENEMLQKALYIYGSGTFYFLGTTNTTLLSSGDSEKVAESITTIQEIVELDNQIYELEEAGKNLSPEERAQIEEWSLLKQGRRDRMEILQAEREQDLTNRAMHYLKTNPGKTLVMTFGAGHNTCNEFRDLKHPPIVKSIIYPKLYGPEVQDARKLMESCSDEIRLPD